MHIDPVAPGLCLDVAQLADQAHEPRGQLIRPTLVLGQSLQRVVQISPAVRPATGDATA